MRSQRAHWWAVATPRRADVSHIGTTPTQPCPDNRIHVRFPDEPATSGEVQWI